MLESNHRSATAIMDEKQQQIKDLSTAPEPTVFRERSGYLPTLDGWRAVAILWVLQGHSQLVRFGSLSNASLKGTGDRGVELFFALSGLLICTRLLCEEARNGSISLRGFYTRRLFRIQPAALVYLAVVVLFVGHTQAVLECVAAAALMVRNYLPTTVTNWQTAHFWSLAVEEHFYLFLPGFLVLCRRYRLAVMLVLVLAAEGWHSYVLQHLQPGFSSLIFLHTDMRIGGILLGCVAALLLYRHKVRAAAVAYLHPWVAYLYAVAVFYIDSIHQSRFNHTALILVYPLVIVATMLHPEAMTSRLLELAPVRFVGRISYSLYLWQQLFLNPYGVPPAHSLSSHRALMWCVLLGCTLGSYYLVERPMVRRGHKFAIRFEPQS